MTDIDLTHLAADRDGSADAAKGLQLHQPRLRLMDIPRNASGVGFARDAGLSAVKLVEIVGGGEDSWTRLSYQRTLVIRRSFGVSFRFETRDANSRWLIGVRRCGVTAITVPWLNGRRTGPHPQQAASRTSRTRSSALFG